MNIFRYRCRYSFLYLFIILLISCGNNKSGFFVNTIHFPADGISGGTVTYTAHPEDAKQDCCEIENKDIIDLTVVVKEDKTVKYFFKSTEKTGRVIFRSGKRESITLYFADPGIDSDADGFPDSAELN